MAVIIVLMLIAVTVSDMLSLSRPRPLWVASSGILYVLIGLALLRWSDDSVASNILPCLIVLFGIGALLRALKEKNKTTPEPALKTPPDT